MIYHPAIANRQYVAYAHRWTDGRCFYIGACRLSELLAAPDAHQNSEWKKLVTSTVVIKVEIIATFPTLPEAKTAIIPLIVEHNPHCNLHGKLVETSQTQIRCVDTGEIFPNAATAAKSKGIAQSAMSNHLNGRPSYRTVKGLRFERVTE